MYTYKAIIVRLVDGDTICADLDLGMYVWVRNVKIRFLGYNAPEIRGPEKVLGKIAKQALESLISVGDGVTIKITKSDSFGRWLGEVYKKDTNIVETLVKLGYGVSWDGKGTRPVFDLSAKYPLVRTTV